MLSVLSHPTRLSVFAMALVGAMVVPTGQLLVMGDARGNSEDGRYFGLISEDLPYGLAKRVIYRSGEGLVWKPL